MWHEWFRFLGMDAQDAAHLDLVLEVMDKDPCGTDDILGRAAVPLQSLAPVVSVDPLTGRFGFGFGFG